MHDDLPKSLLFHLTCIKICLPLSTRHQLPFYLLLLMFLGMKGCKCFFFSFFSLFPVILFATSLCCIKVIVNVAKIYVRFRSALLVLPGIIQCSSVERVMLLFSSHVVIARFFLLPLVNYL